MKDQGFIDRHLMYVDITFFEQMIIDIRILEIQKGGRGNTAKKNHQN